MMRLTRIIICLGFSVVLTAQSHASLIKAEANFKNFFNEGNIKNLSTAAVSIKEIVLTLGTPGSGIGTWDSNGNTRIPAGSIAEDFLSNANYFQTIRFPDLDIEPGEKFSWSGLDFDLIQSISPLVLSSGPGCSDSGCAVETALNNALFTVYFSNGTGLSSGFASGNIAIEHVLVLSGPSDTSSWTISEPAPVAIMLFGIVLSLAITSPHFSRARPRKWKT